MSPACATLYPTTYSVEVCLSNTVRQSRQRRPLGGSQIKISELYCRRVSRTKADSDSFRSQPRGRLADHPSLIFLRIVWIPTITRSSIASIAEPSFNEMPSRAMLTIIQHRVDLVARAAHPSIPLSPGSIVLVGRIDSDHDGNYWQPGQL
jgi:hypothetical protein